MILEGLVTTLNPNGTVHVGPLGVTVGEPVRSLTLRPLRTSRTYRNLKERPEGVFHVTDDVLLLAQSVVGRVPESVPVVRAEKVDGFVLAGACRWYEFRVEWWDERQDRPRAKAAVVHTGRLRDFFGFNRAKHAVLEAAILAERLEVVPEQTATDELARLKPLVEKTGGPAEKTAFELLEEYVRKYYERRRRRKKKPS